MNYSTLCLDMSTVFDIFSRLYSQSFVSSPAITISKHKGLFKHSAKGLCEQENGFVIRQLLRLARSRYFSSSIFSNDGSQSHFILNVSIPM